MSYFYAASPVLPCWHCTAFVALIEGGAICGRRGAALLQATPQRGCAFAVREVGVDDEPDRVPPALGRLEAKLLIDELRTAASVAPQGQLNQAPARVSKHKALRPLSTG